MRARAAAIAGASTVAVGFVHAAPAALILPAMWRHQPNRLGPLCRWSAPLGRPSVSLTFDDGPDPATLRTLDRLDDLGLRASFFLLGSQLEAYPDIGREILARGHGVATHGYHHRYHLLSSPGAVLDDLARATAVHEEILEERPHFFRPPYGQLALGSLLAARRRALEVVLWSVWGREWIDRDAASVLGRLTRGLAPGAIVLLHDNDVTCATGTGDFTRSLLPELADRLHERGLDSVPLRELVDGPEDGSSARTARAAA